MSEIALPTVEPAPSRVAAPSPEWLRAARRAKQVSWLSLLWMGAEGAIAITAGIIAGSGVRPSQSPQPGIRATL
jgi:hypothetical protein